MKTSAMIRIAAVTAIVGVSTVLTGCQTSVGGQTLPSAYYLLDDVQYFPAGPEFLLTNKVQAIEQYNLDRQGFQGNFGQGDVGGVGGGGPGAGGDGGPGAYDGP